jgi:Fe-S cluster assembly scaffold protein SufB
MNFEEEFKQFVKEYEKSGFVSKDLLSYPRLIVNENKVLDIQKIKGITIKTTKKNGWLNVDVKIKKGTKLKFPIHMCFGFLKDKGVQKIKLNFIAGSDVNVSVLSHCFFPKSKNVTHIMYGNFTIGKNARIRHKEEHFHGKNGANVSTNIIANCLENSIFESDFTTKEGVLGKLSIDYNITVGKNAVANSYTKVMGRKKDIINIDEKMNLMGSNSKGLLKSRVAATQKASCVVKSTMKGNGKQSRGHVDCTEIIDGNGKVSAIPIIEVNEKTAHITHEASLGRVNKKQLETLMSKGLSEEEATEVIIKGMLR